MNLTPTLTLEQYFGPYAGHSAITDRIRANAEDLLERVNAVRALAEADGVELEVNPNTGSGISGEKNGGWRPPECPIGAPLSKHKQGQGVDNYDPRRALATWCVNHPEVMREHGLCMEDPRWTGTWCHMQNVPPGPPGSPWRLTFIPDNTPPKHAALKGQVVA